MVVEVKDDPVGWAEKIEDRSLENADVAVACGSNGLICGGCVEVEAESPSANEEAMVDMSKTFLEGVPVC